ncbi:D-hexose-6-phosphate mutarotase [Marinobacteraceae bacterium S3BR75-40.1]
MSPQQPVHNTTFLRRGRLGQLEALQVAHPRFTATVLMQGAQLIEFKPRGEANWLWLSPAEPFVSGRAVRGGIPLCWPWFGDPERNPEAVRAAVHTSAAHGLARLATWQLESYRETVHGVSLSLVPQRWPETDEPLLAALQPRLRLRMDRHCLQLELETHNRSQAPVTYTEALHTYLPTESVRESRVQGLHDRPYIDTLRQWQRCHQHGAVVFRGETDRIYHTTAPLELVTPRTHVRLESSGSGSTVVWNPGPAKAQRLSHFKPADWQRMLCLETANAADDCVTLEPGKNHCLGMTLRRRLLR